MAERLTEYVPGGKGVREQNGFHGTLVGNVRELADNIPRLNVFGDPDLAAFAERMHKIASVDAKDLKESYALRHSTAIAAREAIEDINAKISDYL
jgi:hypothetical protein